MLKLIALLLTGVKFGKLLTTGGTMLVSLVVYAWIIGWRSAAGLLVLLFVHEMGHFIAARYKGLNVGAPTFIPFVGAWVELKDMPHDAQTEAFVGLAGPMLGTVGAIMLTTIWFRVMKGHFTPQRHFGFEAVAWYWHFVDVVWLGLFIFVYWL